MHIATTIFSLEEARCFPPTSAGDICSYWAAIASAAPPPSITWVCVRNPPLVLRCHSSTPSFQANVLAVHPSAPARQGKTKMRHGAAQRLIASCVPKSHTCNWHIPRPAAWPASPHQLACLLTVACRVEKLRLCGS